LTSLQLNNFVHDLPSLIVEAQAEIDKQAEAARLKYITGGAGQAMTYTQKLEEAVAFLAVASPIGADYPIIQAEALATGAAMMAIATNIKATSDAWRPIAASIEAIRMGGKLSLASAGSSSEISAIISTLVWP